MHESIHASIFARYGVDSTIEYWPLPPKTIPNAAQLASLSPQQRADVDLLNEVNEIVTYPIMFGLIIYCLVKR